MTPKERAERLAAVLDESFNGEMLIREAIQEAIAEERAACASLVENMSAGRENPFREIAAAIRSRGRE